MRLADGRGQQRVVRCVASQRGGEIYELRGGGGPQREWRGGEHLVEGSVLLRKPGVTHRAERATVEQRRRCRAARAQSRLRLQEVSPPGGVATAAAHTWGRSLYYVGLQPPCVGLQPLAHVVVASNVQGIL